MLDAAAEILAATPAGVLRRVADDLWIVDAEPIRANGLTLPVRMTVIRLRNGDLWLHSPTQYGVAMQEAIARLGPIRHLVAPNVGHWMFLQPWQRNSSGATTWGAPGLAARRSVCAAGLRIDAELADEAPAPWRGEIDQVLFKTPGFAEVDFFHRASRTMLVSDLLLNVDPIRVPPVSRARSPSSAPLRPAVRRRSTSARCSPWNRSGATQAATRLVAFAPERVIPAHGRPIEEEATAHLRDALG